MSFLSERNQSTWRRLSMKTINTLLCNIVSGSVFIMLSTAFGNYHIFPETQVISEVDISEFPDNCIKESGLHSTMSFSDDDKHFAVWNDEYAEIYDLNFKTSKPIQHLNLSINFPWGKVYRGGIPAKVQSRTTGNIIFTGTSKKYIPLINSSSIFPENFVKLK